MGDEGSGEFIEDLKAFGDHNRVLKVVPDSDDFDIHFGKDDDYYGDDESYTEMIDNYDYEEREDDSVLKVLKDEEKVVEMDIEIKPKPPSAEDELLLDTAQILIMVGSPSSASGSSCSPSSSAGSASSLRGRRRRCRTQSQRGRSPPRRPRS